jgi:steroid delta-isomerase-like uncharacterized protein
MRAQDMDALIERHLQAEMAGDLDGAVAVYTDDVEHDDVGMPGGPLVGKEAARQFYQQLTKALQVEEMRLLRRYHGDEFCVTEHLVVGRAIGDVMGLPGHGQPVRIRLLHVFEFRDGLISRENPWTDTATLAQQLT